MFIVDKARSRGYSISDADLVRDEEAAPRGDGSVDRHQAQR